MGKRQNKKMIPHNGNRFAPTWGAAHKACNGYEVIDMGVMVPAEQIVNKAIEEHVAEVRGQMLVTLLGFLHQKKGFGKKRLEDFSRDYMTYLTDMQIYKIAPIEIKDALKEECGFDTDTYYATLQEMALKQVEDAKMAQWEHRKEMERVMRGA